MRPYELIEHTADIGLVARGADEAALFVHAAEGFFSLIVPPEEVRESRRVRVTAEGENRQELFLNWLRELLHLFETRRFLGRRFEITHLGSGRIEAAVRGEKLDLNRHSVDKEIKAVTYHAFSLKQDAAGGWTARVLFDI